MKIAVVGATGLVGREMLEVLEERNIQMDELIPVASSRSVGSSVEFNGRQYLVQTMDEAITKRPDFALFAAGGAVSLENAPRFAEQGTVVIDNSSAWRMHEDVKLVVPEVNGHLLTNEDRIIANPNCSTIQLVVALNPLNIAYGIKRLVISTYQSFTGTGDQAVDQYNKELNGEESLSYPQAYHYPIFENCIPHCDEFLDNDYTKEEMKIVHETRKILGAPDIAITATAVRVPVNGGHSESVNVEFVNAFDIADIKSLLSNEKGLILQDDPSRNAYPMPMFAKKKDEVFVGRVRRDESIENGLNLWVVANHIDSTVTDLVVSDEFPAGMSPVSGSESRAATIIGNQIFFDYDSLQHNQWDTIRYRLQYDNTVNSTILFSNAVESNEELEEWERILIQDQTNIFRLNSSSTFPTYSGENCWFVTEIDDDTEAMIQFANIEVNGEKPAVRFWHRMNTEFARNGGFVEISTDGIIWNDARPYFLRNGYECPLAFTTFAIPALQAFSGRSEADQYIDSYIDLSSFKGQTITLRFRFGTNSGEGNEANDETFPFDSGWFIDDLDLIDLSIDDTEACISTSNEQACSGGVMTVLNPQMLSSSSEELVQLSGLKIYPNPASDLVNIEINASESDRAYIEMSDVSGRLIYRDVKQLNKNINLLQLNTADYKPGVYFILLQTKQGIASQKLIIE